MMENDSPLMDFKALPKIELHAHLTGSITRRTLRDLWLSKRAANPSLTLADPALVLPDGKHDFNIKTFFPLFSSYIYHLVNDRPSLEHTTRAVLRDFAADGVVYLELRTTPRALKGEGADESGLTKAEYVRTVLDVVKEFEETNDRMHTRLILSIDRRNTHAEAMEVVQLCRQFAPQGVVGIDLCGDPLAGDMATLTPAFEDARKIEGLGMTLHFGEVPRDQAELELLLGWGPDRLGHVIHVGDDEGTVVRLLKERKLGLELCLSCNVHAGMTEGGFGAHHFGEWWRAGECPIVLCTDDVGVFGSPLSNEYRLAMKHFGLARAEICSLARQGIDVIFGGQDEKNRLRQLMWTE